MKERQQPPADLDYIPVRKREGIPQVGNKIWVQSRRRIGLQPNGTIVQILYEDREVLVRYIGDYSIVDSFTWEDLKYAWTDRLGGTYIIQD